MNAKTLIKTMDRSLLNGYFRKRAALRRRFPSTLCIDTTGRCNLRCVMCCWHEKLSVKNTIMPDEILNRIEPILPNIAHVSLQCNSEPLLNKNLNAVIARFKKANPGLFISFVTNGTLLSADRAEKLIDCGLDELGISIDGACSKTFDKLRRGARFEEVISNIDALNKLKQKKGSRKPALRIITVASTENVSELVEILLLGAKHGASAMSVNGLEAYTEETNRLKLYGMETNRAHAAIFRELRRRAAELGISIDLPSLKMLPYRYCLINTLIIDPDGNVYPCSELTYERPYFYNEKLLHHPRISFGTILDRSLEEIWNSPECRTFRKRLASGDFPECCRSCLMVHSVLCPMD